MADGAFGRLQAETPRVDTGTGAQTGAGWLSGLQDAGPFSSDRNKPQVFFSTTYFLLEKGRQPRLQVGLRVVQRPIEIRGQREFRADSLSRKDG